MTKPSPTIKKPSASRKPAATSRKRTTTTKKSVATAARPRSRSAKASRSFGTRHHLAIVIFLSALFGALGALSVNFSSHNYSYADSTLGPIVGIGSKCIDNRDGKLTDRNSVNLWDCNGGPAQKWIRTSSGTIKNQNSNYCLDVQSASKTPGTIVQLYTCNGTVAQVWQAQSNGTLVNPNSGLCLDDRYGSTANGNQITVYTCNGTAAQSWKLAASTPSTVPPLTVGVPTGDLTGWKQIMAEDFKTNSAIGQFQTTYKNSWCGYNESGKYFNNKVISSHDGMMDFNLDGKLGGAGSFGPGELCHGQTYGRFSMRIKATGAADNGTAIMVWPTSDIWGDGEIDYPEGNFDKTLSLFHHGMGCTQCGSADGLDTKASWQTWHVVTLEWVPSSVKYYLDGNLIKTVTHDVPTTKHRYTIQMAPNGNNPQSGHFLIDWVAMYTRQ